jgi:hypothetical protein
MPFLASKPFPRVVIAKSTSKKAFETKSDPKLGQNQNCEANARFSTRFYHGKIAKFSSSTATAARAFRRPPLPLFLSLIIKKIDYRGQ